MPNEVLIIAGEVSGDMHGAELIKGLKSLEPNLKVSGVGGSLMIDAGMEAFYHIKDFSFLGITEVIKHLPFIKKVQKNLLRIVSERRIGTVVLIDYPGFNLNFAKKLKKLNVKVLYYISPQLWAWGKGRVKKIKKRIDRLFVVFPFEVEFFGKYGIKAEFVGHPLVERIENYKFQSRDKFFENNKLAKEKDILLIMPGSREHEINLMLSELVRAGIRLSEKFNLQPVVAAADNFPAEYFRKVLPELDFKVVTGQNYELLKYSKFGIIKSGTATLEAGLFQLPFIVVYKTSGLTYAIAKRLVNLEWLSLANIVSGKKVVKELIQKEVNEKEIVETVSELLSSEEKLQMLKRDLGKIKMMLSEGEDKIDLASNVLMEINEV